MKYCIIGAGGVGGSIGAAMTDAGCDVTLIARGEHLARMREQGLTVETLDGAAHTVFPVKACTTDEYAETPDVIINTVKGYSIDATVDFMLRVSGAGTIVIPLLNIYGTGARLQEKLPGRLVTDGCIYIAAEIKSPGVLLKKGDIFRVVFGARDGNNTDGLRTVAHDLESAGIRAILSDNIRRDAMKKYAYISPMAAAGLYYDATAGAFQQDGEQRELFCALMREMNAIADAIGAHMDVDIVAVNLRILDSLTPQASTSMQRDIWDGKASELDGLVFEPVRLGRANGVPVPEYERIARKFGFEG